MTLSAYMALRSLSDEEMAKLIGHCTASAVRKWRAGDRFPGTQFLTKIRQVTEGAVCPNDFLPLEENVS